jgi:hypothetical protein
MNRHMSGGMIERHDVEENARDREQANGPENGTEQDACFEREEAHSIR